MSNYKYSLLYYVKELFAAEAEADRELDAWHARGCNNDEHWKAGLKFREDARLAMNSAREVWRGFVNETKPQS